MPLWESLEFESLSPQCSIFMYSTLDYFSQVLNFTHCVMEAYPGYPLLLKGHSLGTWLVVLVSVAISKSSSTVIPVIGFGVPATKEPLHKLYLSLKATDKGKVFASANEWDVIKGSATHANEALNYTKLNGRTIWIMRYNRDPIARNSGVRNLYIKVYFKPPIVIFYVLNHLGFGELG